jgi:transposase-like protein
MTREGHVRFCESAGVRFPRATRPFLKVKRRTVYLYRAIDRDGNLVDVLLSEKRDKAAAEAFFRSARTVTDRVPERVTSDGHDAYPGAITAHVRGSRTPSHQPLLEQSFGAGP